MKIRALKLRCPHMANLRIRSCRALMNPYHPSQFQLEEYCKSPAHIKCPFYLDAMDNMAFAATVNTNLMMKER